MEEIGLEGVRDLKIVNTGETRWTGWISSPVDVVKPDTEIIIEILKEIRDDIRAIKRDVDTIRLRS